MYHPLKMKLTSARGVALAALYALFSSAGPGRAVPACPAPCPARQPDGARIQVYLRGDERAHWQEDDRGFRILPPRGSGFWVYAITDANGNVAPGQGVVGRDDPAQLGLAPHLQAVGASKQEPPQEAAGEGKDAKGLIRTGRMKNLVILVDFPDKPHLFQRPDFRDLFNDPGYRVDGALGSVQEYFAEVSYQTLIVESVVVDWITLDHGYAYYGADDGGVGRDVRPGEMVREALAKLEARGFDFSTVDSNNDGEVDALTIIHAGGGQEYSLNDSRYIWSHQGEMSKTVTYDGRQMRKYHTGPERRGWDNIPYTHGITRIGIICHEMCHFLGLPDLYDRGADSMGVGNFCMMGGGCWNGDYGAQPAHLSAWCKAALMWSAPVEVQEARAYAVPRAEDHKRVYRISGRFPPTQYFLVENRQGVGFDAGLPGRKRGLLIWHVDEKVTDNNNQKHYQVDLEEAGGRQNLELNENGGNDGDYFRNKAVPVFISDTVPNNLSYSGSTPGWNIIGISKPSDFMTFTVASDKPVEEP